MYTQPQLTSDARPAPKAIVDEQVARFAAKLGRNQRTPASSRDDNYQGSERWGDNQAPSHSWSPSNDGRW